jgi:hypothetical protein
MQQGQMQQGQMQQGQYQQMYSQHYGEYNPRPHPRPQPRPPTRPVQVFNSPYHKTPEFYTEEKPDYYESKFNVVLENQKKCVLTFIWDQFRIQVMNSQEDIGEQEMYSLSELSKAEINRENECIKLTFSTPSTEVGWGLESDSDGDVVMGEPTIRLLEIKSIECFQEFIRSLNFITDEYENVPVR